MAPEGWGHSRSTLALLVPLRALALLAALALAGCECQFRSGADARAANERYHAEQLADDRSAIRAVPLPDSGVTCFIYAPRSTYAPAISCVRVSP